jgi:ribosome-binding factor A
MTKLTKSRGPSHRLSRVEAEIMREVATLIERELEDPRIKNICITRAKISPDLRHARIFFTVLEESQAEKATHGLNHAVTYLRRRIGETLLLRVVPQLVFSYDNALRKAEHLVELIDQLDKK